VPARPHQFASICIIIIIIIIIIVIIIIIIASWHQVMGSPRQSAARSRTPRGLYAAVWKLT
jgi:Na+/proline symporter